MRAYRTATGTHSYVDAQRAREHVLKLLESVSVGQIERRSGVHRTSIRVLVGDFPGRPASKRIQRKTELALLATTAEWVGDERGGLVDPTGTRRRLQALVALGWPLSELGRRSGLSKRTLWVVANEYLPKAPVTAHTRDRVRALYDDLSMKPAPPGYGVTFARTRAQQNGWVPPLGWDDDHIDDPDATPAATGESEGDSRRLLVLDDWAELVSAGELPDRAAHRLGVTYKTVERYAYRFAHKRAITLLGRAAA